MFISTSAIAGKKMSTLRKLRFQWWDGFDLVAGVIDKWEPGKLKSEKSYEKSLKSILVKRERLPIGLLDEIGTFINWCPS